MRINCASQVDVTESSIAQQWVNIQTEKDGRAFFKKHQKCVMAILSTYNLSEAYNQTSGSALHSRFIGLARGYKSTRHEDGLRVIEQHRINVQEFDPDKPHYFMITVIFTVLRVQALIFASLSDVIPEINDPLLLETRIPQFIGCVNRFLERARKYFEQYYPDVPKHNAANV